MIKLRMTTPEKIQNQEKNDPRRIHRKDRGKKKDYLGYKVVTQSPEMLLEVLPTGMQVSHVVQIRGANSGS